MDELRCVLAAVGLEADGGQAAERAPAGSGRAGGAGGAGHGPGGIKSGRHGPGGPAVLLSGRLDEAGARAWVDVLGPDRAVSVLLADGLPDGSAAAVRVFRENGWRAAAAAPHVPLEQAWLALDTWSSPPPSPAQPHSAPPPRPTTPPRSGDGAHPGRRL